LFITFFYAENIVAPSIGLTCYVNNFL